MRLVIELDGGYHLLPDQQTDDTVRTAWLEDHGFRVIRFTNDEVIGNTEGIINTIKQYIDEYKK